MFIRSLIFTIGQWLFTPIFSVLALLTFPFSRIKRNQIISLWARSMLWWLRLTCNITYTIQGAEHMPTYPCVILAKHQSAWETLAFQLIFPAQCFVMKRELLWIPFFGWGLSMTSPVAINRSTGREALKQLVAQGKARLSQGLWVVVFPEGTRIKPKTTSKFHIGGAWLATGANATVLPVAHNAGSCWPKNSMLKNSGVITVSIGKPIETSGLKIEALNTQVEAWINVETARLESID
jgi:1-acyl-sn-glycerol-3-phosphate acyltransferase